MNLSRADSEKWSATDRAQRRQLIRILEEMIAELQEELAIEERKQPVVIEIKSRTHRPDKQEEAVRAEAA